MLPLATTTRIKRPLKATNSTFNRAINLSVFFNLIPLKLIIDKPFYSSRYMTN
jgi:hypothetical protein